MVVRELSVVLAVVVSNTFFGLLIRGLVEAMLPHVVVCALIGELTVLVVDVLIGVRV